ncbi:hypothetical protein LCGC14_2625350 [marine sediment metagenome]|uniref:Uncharacterized protein n=1 Tax=marine sediment metagenome TaxID=412755 RepID=A0A0F9APG4_9ZZZZ
MINYRKLNSVIKQLADLKLRSKKSYPETTNIWKDIDQTVRGLQAAERVRVDDDDDTEDALAELEDSVLQLEDVFETAKDKGNAARVRRLIDMIYDI